jgi:hypothetical protein
MLFEERSASSLEVGQAPYQALLFRRPKATKQLHESGHMRYNPCMGESTAEEHAHDEDVN